MDHRHHAELLPKSHRGSPILGASNRPDPMARSGGEVSEPGDSTASSSICARASCVGETVPGWLDTQGGSAAAGFPGPSRSSFRERRQDWSRPCGLRRWSPTTRWCSASVAVACPRSAIFAPADPDDAAARLSLRASRGAGGRDHGGSRRVSRQVLSPSISQPTLASHPGGSTGGATDLEVAGPRHRGGCRPVLGGGAAALYPGLARTPIGIDETIASRSTVAIMPFVVTSGELRLRSVADAVADGITAELATRIGMRGIGRAATAPLRRRLAAARAHRRFAEGDACPLTGRVAPVSTVNASRSTRRSSGSPMAR